MAKQGLFRLFVIAALITLIVALPAPAPGVQAVGSGSATGGYWDAQVPEQSSGGEIRKTYRELPSPASSTGGIYANWGPAASEFGSSIHSPMLKPAASSPATSTDSADGRATLTALYNATDGDNWTNNDNWLTDATLVASGKTGDFVGAQSGNGRYDTDGDSLIEITNLEQLDAIRYDINGDGVPFDNPDAETAYAAAFPTTGNESVCISCNGYELTRSLDFDDPASYASGQVNTEWTTGEGWSPISYLYTTLEGNGFTISNLYINQPAPVEPGTYVGSFVALIGYLTHGGAVLNIGLVDVDVAGWGDNIAGLVAYADSSGDSRPIIAGSYVTGKVFGGDSEQEVDALGGLVGYNAGVVIGSYSSADVSSSGLHTGGLAGWNVGEIIACYATGSVTGTVIGHSLWAGGLTGQNDGNITSSFAAAEILSIRPPGRGPSAFTGGLVGSNYGSGTISNSYWDTQVSGQTAGAGVGEPPGVEGKTTSELQSPTGYTGIYATWDETEAGDVWDFGTSSDYPTLKPFVIRAPEPASKPSEAGDYDADDDGLIEVANLAQLNAIRWDLDGDGVATDSGYGAAFPGAVSGMGCPGSGCTGYELTANLDFDTNGNGRADAGDTYWNGGEGWLPIGHWISGSNPNAFGATFDGGGRTISNLYINRGAPRQLGLFGWVDSDATIRRVGVVSVDVTGVLPVDQSGRVGGLAGLNNGTIADSYATGSVGANNSYIGGLVGYNNRAGTITGSHAAVTLALSVTGNQGSTPGSTRIHSAGGLVGSNGGTTTDSYATGNVTGNVGNRIGQFGGLVGGMCGGAIINSYATGNVAGEATGSGRGRIGGLAGSSASGNITNSYATGGLAGSGSNANVGGQNYVITNLVEDDAGGFITASYAESRDPGQSNTGGVPNRVTGSGNTEVGGLVGLTTTCRIDDADLPASTAADSYWDTQTSGQSSSDGGIGKTTRELQSPTSNTGIYANWDPAVWGFGTSSQYPTLKSSVGTTTPPAPSAPCVEDLGTLTADVSRAGEWTADCASVTKSGNYARFYSFTLGQEREVTIGLTSSEDTVLSLLRGAGTDGQAITSNDDVGSGNTNSQIIRTLEAGTYTIEATTFGTRVTGSFNLSVALTEGTGQPEPPPPISCIEDLGTLTASTSQAGSWTRDCPSSSEPNTFARFYSFTLGAETEVTMHLVSDRDTVLYLRGPVPGGELFNNDAEQGNSNSRISATLPAGAYTLEASTYVARQTGDFTLTITLAGDTGTPGSYDSDGNGTIELPELFDAIDDYFAGDIPLTDLFDIIDFYFSGDPINGTPGEDTCVETVTGSGPVSGEWTAGCESSEPGRGYARYYTFTLGRFTDVTITLTRVSGNADPYLYLRRGTEQSGASLRENDGREGDPTESEISARLARGTYTVEATTFAAEQTGSFTLSIAQPETDKCLEDLRGPIVDTVGLPGRSWDSDCVSEEREGSYAKYFRFTLDREAEVTITLESQDANPYLYLREGEVQSGAHLADNDDLSANPRNTNSQIIRTLAAGTYTIEATTSIAGQSGSFTLSITGPPGPQRAALLDLYEATGGDNWINNTNWGSNGLVREWHGVDTDKHGHVIGLSLGGNRLSGQIPADLDWSAFTYLEWLDLGDNQLTGPIPGELGDLPALKSLYLNDNQLHGTIPAGLSRLSHLERLNLSGNRLSGEIPGSLADLPNLEVLWLHDNQFTGCTPRVLKGLVTTGRGVLPDFCIPEHPEERAALLALYSRLGGEDSEGKRQFREDFLTGWKSDDLGPFTVFAACISNFEDRWREGTINFSEFIELYELLNLHIETITDSVGGTATPECLAGNPPIVRARVILHNILDRSPQSAFRAILPWPNQDGWGSDKPLDEWYGVEIDDIDGHVIELDLSGNNLDGELGSELGGLTALTRLDLSGNFLDGGIGAWLGQLSSLERLDLSSNFLSGRIPWQLSEIENLTDVNLSDNGLTGQIPRQLGQIIPSEGGNLKTLYLYDNDLEGCIPRSLLALLTDDVHRAKEKLDVELRTENLRNVIVPAVFERAWEGWILPTYGLWLPPCPPPPPELPPLLGSNPILGAHLRDNLALLAIRDHFVKAGSDESEFRGWSDNNLNILRLSEDCGVGAWHGVETEWQQYQGGCRVVELSLDKRELKGTIPKEVGYLTSLRKLNLSRNCLTEPIPAELGHLSDLKVLALNSQGSSYVNECVKVEQEGLQNELPPEIGNLGSLTMLNLFENPGLTGKLPPEFGNLANLEHLKLENTDFSGCVPPPLVQNFAAPLITKAVAPLLAFGAVTAFTGATGITFTFLQKRLIGPIVSKVIGLVLDPAIKPGAEHWLPWVGSELHNVKLYCD